MRSSPSWPAWQQRSCQSGRAPDPIGRSAPAPEGFHELLRAACRKPASTTGGPRTSAVTRYVGRGDEKCHPDACSFCLSARRSCTWLKGTPELDRSLSRSFYAVLLRAVRAAASPIRTRLDCSSRRPPRAESKFPAGMGCGSEQAHRIRWRAGGEATDAVLLPVIGFRRLRILAAAAEGLVRLALFAALGAGRFAAHGVGAGSADAAGHLLDGSLLGAEHAPGHGERRLQRAGTRRRPREPRSRPGLTGPRRRGYVVLPSERAPIV